MKRPAVFLDRDDTLIRNIPYLGDPARVEILPHVREGLQLLHEGKFLLFIISNQSGVGRGLITREQVEAVNKEMNRQMGANFFTGIYNCYAAPEDPYCDERKPSPAMVLQAEREHDLDLTKSFFVGDRLIDIRCGHNAGCRSILVATGTSDSGDESARAHFEADFAADHLLAASQWICSNAQ